MCWLRKGLLLLLLSHFSRVRLCATSQTAAHQALSHPWDSPGKNTGVGCHFLLQSMKVKSESEVAQSCLTPCDPMDRSLPGSSVHGIFQTRRLEWVAIAFEEGVEWANDPLVYHLEVESPEAVLRAWLSVGLSSLWRATWGFHTVFFISVQSGF